MADTEQPEAPVELQSRNVIYCGGTLHPPVPLIIFSWLLNHLGLLVLTGAFLLQCVLYLQRYEKIDHVPAVFDVSSSTVTK
jgi:hypothetical protein